MRTPQLTLLALAASMSFSQFVDGSESGSERSGRWNRLDGSYMIHSGGTAYAGPPTKSDSALTVHFEGKAAKDVFDQIGPDDKVKCSAEQRDRERSKKGVSCIYTAKLNDPKDAHYTCWIGINLRTGEGDVRVSC
jgi:hypothetical protein